jgi:putative DNA primase/helicase
MGEKWLIQAVARAFEPGCQADSMLVLEGEQGILKSTALRKLAVKDEWFGSSKLDLSSKDAAINLFGIWIYEIQELTAIRKSEAEEVKQFITNRIDRFRLPYDKLASDHKRGGVLAGSTNRSDWSRDSTGDRRFYPVECEKCAPEGIEAIRDQLWAEASTLYHEGINWWLDASQEELAREVQKRRWIADPWESAIEKYLHSHDTQFITAEEILDKVIDMKKDKQEDRHARKISEIMQRMGWKHGQKRLPNRERSWGYSRPQPANFELDADRFGLGEKASNPQSEEPSI